MMAMALMLLALTLLTTTSGPWCWRAVAFSAGGDGGRRSPEPAILGCAGLGTGSKFSGSRPDEFGL